MGVGAALIVIASTKRKRCWWKKAFLRSGEHYGDHLMSQLLLNDGGSSINFVRIKLIGQSVSTGLRFMTVLSRELAADNGTCASEFSYLLQLAI